MAKTTEDNKSERMTPNRYMMQQIEKSRDNPKGYTVPPRKPIFVPDEPTPAAKKLMKKGKRVAFT